NRNGLREKERGGGLKINKPPPDKPTTRRCETAFKYLCRLPDRSFVYSISTVAILSLPPSDQTHLRNSILHATPNPKDSIFFGSLRLMGYNNQPDPDAVRWGLHDLEVCTLTNAGSCRSVTRYETDGVADQGYVREGYNNNQTLTGSYVDNDAVIAQFYQDELSRVDRAEASNDPSRTSVVEQEWPPHPRQGEAIDISHERDGMEDKNVARLGNQGEGSSPGRDDDESVCSIEIEEESWSEFGKRLNHMIPIAHVPKINGELPSEDEQVSDHQRLSQRLQLYGLVENKIQGDGNCQFRALSDQLYRSSEHHSAVREQVINQSCRHLRARRRRRNFGFSELSFF
ncbi:unnamed protein product, partial [Brassica oleracea]